MRYFGNIGMSFIICLHVPVLHMRIQITGINRIFQERAVYIYTTVYLYSMYVYTACRLWMLYIHPVVVDSDILGNVFLSLFPVFQGDINISCYNLYFSYSFLIYYSRYFDNFSMHSASCCVSCVVSEPFIPDRTPFTIVSDDVVLLIVLSNSNIRSNSFVLGGRKQI